MAVAEVVQVYAKPKVPFGTQPINTLRWVLAEADRLYFEEVARAVLDAGMFEVAYTVPYPDLVLDPALAGLAAEGWGAGTDEIVALLWKFGRRLFTFAASPRDEALGLLVNAEKTIPPTDAINRYVATRIPPLKYQVETRRRLLCRDIVGDAAREGVGLRDAMARLQDEGFGRSAWHRETIARTEASTLYNFGKHARFHSSGAVSGMMFEAIVDARTTETCAYLDGREFKVEEADGAIPPLHFSCRSTLSPILWFDEPEAWQSSDTILDLPEGDARLPMRGWGRGRGTEFFPPRGTVTDFLRPLAESEKAAVRGLLTDLEAKAEALWGPNWRTARAPIETVRQAANWDEFLAIATDAEKAAIGEMSFESKGWLGLGAPEIKAADLTGKGTSAALAKARDLRSALAKVPSYQGDAWRGMSLLPDEFLFEEGMVVETRSFTSMTADKAWADRFLDATRTGVPRSSTYAVKLHFRDVIGADLRVPNAMQHEVLLDRGARFKVVRINVEAGAHNGRDLYDVYLERLLEGAEVTTRPIL